MRMLIVMAALLATGCSPQAVRDPVPAGTAHPPRGVIMAGLDGTEWRFVRVEGESVPAGVRATMRIRSGRISGQAGCNTYGVRYQIAPDGSIAFSQVLSTKVACLAPAGAMQVEHRIFRTLPDVAGIKLHGGELALLDARGNPVAQLQPAKQP